MQLDAQHTLLPKQAGMQQGDGCPPRPWPARKAAAAAILMLLLYALLHMYRHAVGRLQAIPSAPLSPECMHALGGGLVGSGGSFPHIVPEYCRDQMKTYISDQGGYWLEVEAAADSALAAFGLLGTAERTVGTPKNGLVVLDIDETALSNAPFFSMAAAPARGSLHSINSKSWNDWVRAARSPALQPTLRVYKALHAAGYRLAFVTGRADAMRNATAANLAAVGYGSLCSQHSNGSEHPGQRDQQEPCYVQLMMRPAGDTRLASVYKPWARAQLLADGFILSGSLGDQFSDLNGEHVAHLCIKYPNVWYYIL